MEAHMLRFVRCPKCLQLLVEYPSIPVYQCGGCGTVLRAKNRGVPVTHTDPGSGEHNSFPCSLEGSPQISKSICSDEQKIVSSNAPPSENVVEGDTFSGSNDANSCENVNPERTVSIGETATVGELENENYSLSDGNAGHPEFMLEGTDDKGTEANCSPKMIENVEKAEAGENANGEKAYDMDNANDGSVVSEVAAIHSMADEELGADFSNNMRGEIGSVTEQNYSASNKNMNRQEITETDKPYEEDGAISNNRLARGEETLQPYEDLHIGSYEDLIEELERSLSLSDDEEDFLDVADNNGLNDALHYQFGSRRFSSRGKVNDDSRNDPHGQLIEELERSFSDVEEPFEHHVVVADKGIAEKVHGNKHDKDPQSLVDESAHPCEGSISSLDDGHIKSAQIFQQKEITADGTKEKEEGHMEDDNTIGVVHRNEHVMVTNKGISEIGHGNENDEDLQNLDSESANLCDGSISSFDHRHLKSGQCFHQHDLTADDNEEKKDSCMEDNTKIHSIHVNGHVLVTNEDIAERIHVNKHDKDLQYLDIESAKLYEESISSLDYGYLKPGQNFQQHEPTSDGTEEKKEGHTEDDNMNICVQADNAAAVAGFSSLSNERIHCKSPSFNKKKEEISCRYRASLLRQGLSLDSEDFKSIQNFIESQMDGTSSSLSSGSPSQGDLVLKTSNKFKTVDQLERFKKMDELRDQLNRLSGQKGLERRYQKKGLEYQSQLSTYDAEQHFESVDADSIPSSCTLESYYGNGKPPMYPPPNPFSPPHSCVNCHFGHVQAHVPHNYDAWEFNSYYRSSHAGSSILDYDSLKSSFKEQKRVVRKHILRPLSGASPYTVCDSCFNLVQVPSDMYMSKRKVGKMQCGQCSKVIVLSFPAVNHVAASISKEVARTSSKTDGRIVEDASHCISISEEYGASFTRSFSTQAGSARAASQSCKKVSESALHRLMGYDSASQLLRHSRAFERHSRVFDDGYESFESMVPVSSRVSRRKNM